MSTPSRLQFGPRLLPLLAAVGAVTFVAAVTVLAHVYLFGPEPASYPEPAATLFSVPFMAVIVVGTWAVLRREGTQLAALGLGKVAFVSGVLAFFAVWVLVVVSGLAYLRVTGTTGAIGLSVEMTWPETLLWFLLTLTIANGLPEELVFRGYAQNKIAALVGDGGRIPPAAVGIVAAALLFGVPHLPLGLLVTDAGVGLVPGVLLANLVPGIAYGLVYYVTRNLWYTSFIHGFGNATLVPFDPAAVPYFVPATTIAGLLVGLGYRYWARRTDRLTVRIQRTVG